MVRCERYNANLTSLGCKRKKESAPPRVKNSSMSDEESIQNHPCFGCLGPIVINWDVDRPPIALHEVETTPIILHPNLEDGFSANRARRLKEDSENRVQRIPSFNSVLEKGGQAKEVTSEDDVAIGVTAKEAKVQAEVEAQTAPKAPSADSELTIVPQETEAAKPVAEAPVPKEPEPVEEKVEEKVEAKPKKVSKGKKKTSKVAEETKPAEKETPVEEVKETTKSKAPAKTKDTEETKAAKEETKDESAEETKESSEEKKASKGKKPKKSKKDDKKGESTADGEHPPCASCGREYTPKYWRGDICNPCYARRLRQKKKEQQQAKTKKDKKDKKEHPPCTNCGREYTPKHWRGDICNPCYARRLRQKKKEKQKEKEKSKKTKSK